MVDDAVQEKVDELVREREATPREAHCALVAPYHPTTCDRVITVSMIVSIQK